MFKKEWHELLQTIDKINLSGSNELCNSTLFQNLLIAGEDHRFIRHCGVDYYSLFRAAWKTFIIGQREGGSTIAMQLVRVLTNRYERTFSRKVLEMYLARRLTGYISKKKITSLYLSVAYFGWEMDGLTQAVKRLDLDPKNLSLDDIAGIIARLKYPQPRQYSENRERQIKYRTQYILKRYQNLKLGTNNDSI